MRSGVQVSPPLFLQFRDVLLPGKIFRPTNQFLLLVYCRLNSERRRCSHSLERHSVYLIQLWTINGEVIHLALFIPPHCPVIVCVSSSSPAEDTTSLESSGLDLDLHDTSAGINCQIVRAARPEWNADPQSS